jgi:transposase
MRMAAPPEQMWSEGQKRAVVAQAFAPGASVSEVARRVDIVPVQIYRWRREFGSGAAGIRPPAARIRDRCS